MKTIFLLQRALNQNPLRKAVDHSVLSARLTLGTGPLYVDSGANKDKRSTM